MKSHLATIKEWIESADALVINAGAGMGVDSGLPDFRGKNGQWGVFEKQSEQSVFTTITPRSFEDNPALVWKIYAERIDLYSRIAPHEGFYILKKWIDIHDLDYFVLTSNIDGQFQKAGYHEDRIREVHGSISYFQCLTPVKSALIWKNKLPASEIIKGIETNKYPVLPGSDIPARPNVLMFRDDSFNKQRSLEQQQRFLDFLDNHNNSNILVFEIGSGPHVQTIRQKTRMLKKDYHAQIIRINPVHYKTRPPGLGIQGGALKVLQEINNYLEQFR